MKKSYISLIVAAAVLLTATIGFTLAYLISSSNKVENTFTVGNISISLNETTGSEYKMAPGVTILKDPTITVEANSDACWLFVKTQTSSNFGSFCEFEIGQGWQTLQQNEGVYYQRVEKSAVNQKFKVLKNDRIYVKDTLTEEDFNALLKNPTLKVTAYAIQCEGMLSALDAWQQLNIIREEE